MCQLETTLGYFSERQADLFPFAASEILTANSTTSTTSSRSPDGRQQLTRCSLTVTLSTVVRGQPRLSSFFSPTSVRRRFALRILLLSSPSSSLLGLYPGKIFLNRGNHETADMNKVRFPMLLVNERRADPLLAQVYGFEGETKKKYSELTYKLFEEVFTARAFESFLSRGRADLPVLLQFPSPPSSRPPSPHDQTPHPTPRTLLFTTASNATLSSTAVSSVGRMSCWTRFARSRG